MRGVRRRGSWWLVCCASLVACGHDPGGSSAATGGSNTAATGGGQAVAGSGQSAAGAAPAGATAAAGGSVAGSSAAGSGGAGSGGAAGEVGGSGAGDGGSGALRDGGPLDATQDARPAPEAGLEPDAAVAASPFVYVGTGAWGGAEPGRIAVYRLGEDGSLSFVEQVDAGGIAAFMAADRVGRRLYVADEGAAEVLRFSVDPATGRLAGLQRVPASGSPVYIALDSQARSLMTANYTQGSANLFALEPAGVTTPPVEALDTGSQAHAILPSPDDGFVYVCNKGAETVSQFRLDPTLRSLTPLSPPSVSHAGGPRHLAFGAQAGVVYVISELQDSIGVYSRAADGTLSELQRIARLPGGDNGSGADIQVSTDGRFVYATNRAPSNTLAVYRVEPASGRLALVEHEPSGGQTPRNFALDGSGRFLLVGNRESQNVVVFEIDADSGALERKHTVGVPGSPFFVGVYSW